MGRNNDQLLPFELDFYYYNLLLSLDNMSPKLETQFPIYYLNRESQISLDKFIQYLQEFLQVFPEQLCATLTNCSTKLFKTLSVQKPYLVLNVIYYYLLRRGFSKVNRYKINYADLFKIIPALRINTLSTNDDNKLGRVTAIIKSNAGMFPILKLGTYICKNCKHEYKVYHEYNYYKVPSCHITKECKKGDVMLDEARSLYVDVFKVDLQQVQQDLGPGEQPKTIVAFTENRTGIKLTPGLEAQFAVIVKKHNLETKGTPFYQRYFEIIALNDYRSNKTIKKNLEQQIIQKLKNYEEFEQYLLNLITPINLPIEVKRAVLLQLIGGVRKPIGENTFVRGDIHILIVGNPGIGKSQLLKNSAKISKGIFVSAISTTSVGLTAAVVKDNTINGKWAVQAGAFVFADNKYLAIDEIDKVPNTQLMSIHEAMQQQSVSLAKAGLMMTLNTRCPLLAAANPIHGEFITETPVHKQINLSPTIINRFDLVFLLNEQIDTDKLSESVLSTGKRKYTEHDYELFNQYIQLCKSKTPVMNKIIQRYVTDLYKKIKKHSSMLVTARQFECIIRLIEAKTRARLSDVMIEEDFKYVEKIFLYTTGQQMSLDTNYIETGIPKKQFQYRRQIIQLVKCKQKITHKELISNFAQSDNALIEKLLDRLVGIQVLYKPTHNTYAII